ncbi:head decoration protein [Bradyrhizobium japonicum]|uniref:head decoration protein n=1 Tax=Bradyrhizobium japonicum TaxID=375 RepID=UPI001E436705|nr:head decoration protein [Bradyrhizobium japonicum]MCD9821195.1 head decoration protein [Bradyrhizobium japonicum]MEB2674109.1 head decoration protein [Bradyrhizobium japonicum]WRI93296.1 head decoration protein [Bradyrhizobium japonicum]
MMARTPHEHERDEPAREQPKPQPAQVDNAKAAADAEKKAEEGRKAMHEREQKRLEDEFKENEARIAAERERKAEQEKEAERRAKMSPEELAAEVSPFAATVPHFTVLNEPHHSAEFILSEANGQRSRGAAYFADPATIVVGMPVKKTAEATATQPATYVPAAAGADCHALAMYSGGTIPGEGLRIAVLVRDAEVNKNLITWGAITAPEQVIGLQTLATNGIIAR